MSVPSQVLFVVAMIEDVLARVPVTDWQDEFRLRIEDAEEMRDCLEKAVKVLLEVPGWKPSEHDGRKVA